MGFLLSMTFLRFPVVFFCFLSFILEIQYALARFSRVFVAFSASAASSFSGRSNVSCPDWLGLASHLRSIQMETDLADFCCPWL